MARALNDKAELVEVEYGKVSPIQILGSPGGASVIDKDDKDEHSSHSHAHDHDSCNDPDCSDPSHGHSRRFVKSPP